MKKSFEIKDGFYIICGWLCILAGYVRLYYGVDLLDEAWYVSTIHQFSLGAEPLVNEFSIQQFPFVLMLPIYKVFAQVSFLGLGKVLFVRHLYFFIECMVVTIIYYLLKKSISKSMSFGLASIMFIDLFGIPSISYNTIGKLFFTMALILFVIGYNECKENIGYFFSAFAGIAFSICVYSYITYVIPVGITFLILFILLRKEKGKLYNVFITFFAFMTSNILIFFVLLSKKLNDLMIDYSMFRTINAHTGDIFEKWLRLGNIGKLFVLPLGLLFIYKILCRITRKKFFIIHILIIVGIFIYPFINESNNYVRYSWLVTLISFTGIAEYILFADRQKKFNMIIFIAIIVPLCLAGITTGLTSANGYTNICIGISPCAIFSLYIIREIFKETKMKEWHFKIVSLIAIALYVFLLINNIYGEGTSILNLNEKIENGPYKGIYTVSETKDFLDELHSDLENPIIKNKNNILCYYNFPAGYMFNSLKNDLYSTWILNLWMTRQSFEKMLSINDKRRIEVQGSPDIIVRYRYDEHNYKGLTVGPESDIGYDPIGKRFGIDSEHYFEFKKTDKYIILIKKDTR